MDFVFGVFLIILSAILLVIEIFIPSFGLLSICAICSLVGGIWIFFEHSAAAGWIGVGISAVLFPVVWIISYRIFPKTRFGKSVSLEGPKREPGDAIPDTPELAGMLGKRGVVITPLRPVGMCDFEGKRLECVAERGYVGKDKKIVVIDVEGTQLTVRLEE